MISKTIILFITIFTLVSCINDPEGNLKRSANNKLFDTKGFEGGKRLPLYNKKYINQAKKNITNNSLDDDLEDEHIDNKGDSYHDTNIEMYKLMIDEDTNHSKKSKKRSSSKSSNNLRKTNRGYPNLSEVERYNDPNLELKEELEQIKKILNETKKEMASYKCPTADEQEYHAKNILNNKVSDEKAIKPDTTATKLVNTTEIKPDTTATKPANTTETKPDTANVKKQQNKNTEPDYVHSI